MKAFIAILFAVAAAEPQTFYHHQGQPLAYNAHQPLVYNAHQPLAYNTQPLAYNTWPLAQPIQYVPKVEQKKEEEEVHTYKQEEKPSLVYKYAPIVPYYQPHLVKPVQYVATSAGVQHVVHKREAEAESYYPYSSYVTPYSYGQHPYNYNPVTYAAPAAAYHHQTYAVPTTGHFATALNPFQAKSYSNDAVRPEQYAAKGSYVANSGGAVHIAKREAEAESQYLSYGSYPHNNYYNRAFTTYNTRPYNTPYVYNNRYNTAFGYNSFSPYYNY